MSEYSDALSFLASVGATSAFSNQIPDSGEVRSNDRSHCRSEECRIEFNHSAGRGDGDNDGWDWWGFVRSPQFKFATDENTSDAFGVDDWRQRVRNDSHPAAIHIVAVVSARVAPGSLVEASFYSSDAS